MLSSRTRREKDAISLQRSPAVRARASVVCFCFVFRVEALNNTFIFSERGAQAMERWGDRAGHRGEGVEWGGRGWMALIPDPSSRSACRLSLFPLFPFPVPHLISPKISPPSLCAGGPAQLTRHPLRPGCATPHFTCALFYMKLEAQQDLLPGPPLCFLGKDEETGSSALSSTPRTLTKIYVLSNLTKRCSWKVRYTLASLSVPLSYEHELQPYAIFRVEEKKQGHSSPLRRVGKLTLLRHTAMREVPFPPHITILFVEQV